MNAPDLSKEPYAQAVPASPLIRRVLARNASPFSYTGTQTHIIGNGAVAVVDPGPLGDDPRHVEELIRLLDGEKVVAILCTHTHRDHSPAALPLAQATGAAVIGCAPLVLADDGPRADASFDDTYTPDQILGDGDAVSGPGWTLRALATPGHTSNHLCFSLEEEQALFTGDHVMGWSTSVVSPPDGDMAAYMESLALLQAREDARYYPAHGEPVDKPQRLVRGMIVHRRQREAQILTQLDSGPQSIVAMVPNMYKGIDPRLHPAAGRSVLAHLIDLQAKGRVQVEGDVWGLM
jgi:glyoxylase-like metal-dependent hydrolase (beta-lactamase superfamily II)